MYMKKNRYLEKNTDHITKHASATQTLQTCKRKIVSLNPEVSCYVISETGRTTVKRLELGHSDKCVEYIHVQNRARRYKNVINGYKSA